MRLLACLCAGTSLVGVIATSSASQARVAFVNVNVVPMDSERVISRQTLVIEGDRIVSMGMTGVTAVPNGFRVIDGHGAYVLPGIADMHVHFAADSDEMLLYVASGVTTVRELSGEPLYLEWRREISAGARTGPRMYIASPALDAPQGRRAFAWRWGGTATIATLVVFAFLGSMRALRVKAHRGLIVIAAAVAIAVAHLLMATTVPFPDALIPRGRALRLWIGSPGEAAREVRRAATKYDQIKLYENLSRPEFEAAVGAARAAGIHTVAHVPFSEGLERTLHSGLDELAHVYFLVEELQRTTDTTALAARMQAIVREVRASKVDVTSTLMPMPDVYQEFTDSAAFLARDDFRYRTPAARDEIRVAMRKGMTPAELRDVQMHITWGSVAAAALVHAGVPLVLGTDDSPFTSVAGFGAHTELHMLVAAGLTPFEALRTATVNASRIVGASSQWGTVAVGHRADLLLVNGNPLTDLETLRRPLGVMAGGRWYDRPALDSLLVIVANARSGS